MLFRHDMTRRASGGTSPERLMSFGGSTPICSYPVSESADQSRLLGRRRAMRRQWETPHDERLEPKSEGAVAPE